MDGWKTCSKFFLTHFKNSFISISQNNYWENINKLLCLVCLFLSHDEHFQTNFYKLSCLSTPEIRTTDVCVRYFSSCSQVLHSLGEWDFEIWRRASWALHVMLHGKGGLPITSVLCGSWVGARDPVGLDVCQRWNFIKEILAFCLIFHWFWPAFGGTAPERWTKYAASRSIYLILFNDYGHQA